MNITQTAVKFNRPTIGIFIVLFILGISSFNSMPRDDMPPFKIRFMQVITQFPGASPERMELLVSDKIESAVQEVAEVKNINSENRTGISIISIELKDDVQNLQPVFDKLRRKINRIESNLPQGCQPPSINDEFGDTFGILLGLESDGYTYAEQKSFASDIRDELIRLDNTGKVTLAGVISQTIYVSYDRARLAEIGLTATRLKQIIESNNIVSSGGSIVLGDRRITLEPSGDYQSIEDVKRTLISSDKGEVLYLSDVAKVHNGYVFPINHMTKIRGVQGLVIAVNLKEGANITDLGEEVDVLVRQTNNTLPYGLSLVRLASQDRRVNKSISEFTVNLAESIAIVLAVMLIFLGLRTGLVVASLIPATILVTFLIMKGIGLGLNQVTLASLIIALGMLVDNAIVVSESYMVKTKNGASPLSAAFSTADELFIPLLTSTLTTSAAFLAFFLAQSAMGEIMGNIFLVVTAALLSSWIISLTLIPMLCIVFIKNNKKTKTKTAKHKPSFFDRLLSHYDKLQRWALFNPYKLIGILVGMFFLSMLGFKKLPFLFFPDSDRNLIYVKVQLAPGSKLENTNQAIGTIEHYLRDSLWADEYREGVTNFSSYLGQGAPKYDLGYTPVESDPSSGYIIVNTTSGNINQYLIDRLNRFIFNALPAVESFQVSRLKGGGGSADPVAIRISGEDIPTLFGIVNRMKSKLQSIKGTVNVDDNWGLKAKKVLVKIDQAKADLAGVSNYDIAVSLQTALLGKSTGEYRENDKVIPILLRSENSENITIDELRGTNVYAQQSGGSVPLDQVASLEIVWEHPKILRRNLKRTITLSAQLKEGATATEVMAQMIPALNKDRENWPQNYSYSLGGEAEDSATGIGSIAKNLPISAFIIFLLLLIQFNSLRKTAIIGFTIPLGLIGCVAGLLIARSYFGFFGFLGVVSLAGVIVNNAIVLIDRIKIEQDELGKDPFQAIVDAGKQRFRPILLTTFTTAFGLVPLWLNNGMWVPMAVSIIFGLLFGTVLTLVFVPVLYMLMFKISRPS
ncbi:MAG: efflux RND transporter permease subunit [Cytophagales bacterium]|nr:efflux RND transporter permease subunit [Cytophagales bacterium]